MQPSFASVSRCCQDVLAFAEELVAEFWLAVSEAHKADTETVAGCCCVGQILFCVLCVCVYIAVRDKRSDDCAKNWRLIEDTQPTISARKGGWLENRL